MYKRIFIMALLLLISAPQIGLAARPGKTGAMNVQVRQVFVRANPDYMASNKGQLSYGDRVNVIGESGNWFQIDKPAGWLPKSALTKHDVKVDPDQRYAAGNVKHDEVALAGKGFNPQVEAKYKKDNRGVANAYREVDKVETLGASDGELKQFKTQGKLK